MGEIEFWVIAAVLEKTSLCNWSPALQILMGRHGRGWQEWQERKERREKKGSREKNEEGRGPRERREPEREWEDTWAKLEGEEDKWMKKLLAEHWYYRAWGQESGCWHPNVPCYFHPCPENQLCSPSLSYAGEARGERKAEFSFCLKSNSMGSAWDQKKDNSIEGSCCSSSAHFKLLSPLCPVHSAEGLCCSQSLSRCLWVNYAALTKGLWPLQRQRTTIFQKQEMMSVVKLLEAGWR